MPCGGADLSRASMAERTAACSTLFTAVTEPGFQPRVTSPPACAVVRAESLASLTVHAASTSAGATRAAYNERRVANRGDDIGGGSIVKQRRPIIGAFSMGVPK